MEFVFSKKSVQTAAKQTESLEFYITQYISAVIKSKEYGTWKVEVIPHVRTLRKISTSFKLQVLFLAVKLKIYIIKLCL